MSYSSKNIPNRYTNSMSEKKSSHLLSSGKKIPNEMSDFTLYEQPLIGPSYEHNNTQQLDIYDPFESPPSRLKAERHQKATSIGIPVIDTNNVQSIQICPCCENPINKKQLSVLSKQEQLLFLGVGYPLYYKLARYVGFIVLFVFLISGNGLYSLLTVDCHVDNKCIDFLYFKIPNIDPEYGHQSSRAVEFMNMFTAIGIFVFALYIKSLINDDITELESNVICPSQYTIMLSNLGKNYDESQLKKWLRQNLHAQPVVINCAYNIQQLQKAYEKRNQLTIELRKSQIKRSKLTTTTNNINSTQQLTLSSHKINSRKSLPPVNYIDTHMEISRQRELVEEIERCDKLINDFKNNQIDCDKNGTAFVTFQHAQTVADLIEKYEQSEMSLFVSRALYSVIRQQTSLVFNNKQIRFYINRSVKISRAPAPREIIWHNLSYSYFKSLIFQFVFVCCMFMLIYFAFQYQFKFSAYAYKLRQQSKHTGQKFLLFQAVIASLIVISLNSLLRIIIFIFSKLKRYHSYTAQQSAFCFYYTLMYVFNSCFMIYIVHGQYPEEETNQLLLVDIHIIMLANAFSEPLFKLFDPIMWYKIISRRYVASLPSDRNPYTQMYMNNLFQGHEISNGDNYQYLARILIIPVWFAYAAPMGVVISFLGMFVDCWIGKIMLIKCYKKPQNISKDIALVVINTFQLLPLIYICGLLQFTYKATVYENSSHNVSIVDFLMSFFNYSITGTVLIICITGYLLFIKTKNVVVQKEPYHKIQNYFGFNYETQNPVTRYRGDVNYLQTLMNSPEIKNQKVSIGELKLSMGDDVERRRLNVAKIKVKMEHMTNEKAQSSDEMDFEMRDLSEERDIFDDKIRESLDESLRSSSRDNISKTKKPKRGNFFIKRTKSIFA